MDDGSEDKKAKDTKQCIIKRNLNLKITTKLDNKIKYLEKKKLV